MYNVTMLGAAGLKVKVQASLPGVKIEVGSISSSLLSSKSDGFINLSTKVSSSSTLPSSLSPSLLQLLLSSDLLSIPGFLWLLSESLDIKSEKLSSDREGLPAWGLSKPPCSLSNAV